MPNDEDQQEQVQEEFEDDEKKVEEPNQDSHNGENTNEEIEVPETESKLSTSNGIGSAAISGVTQAVLKKLSFPMIAIGGAVLFIFLAILFVAINYKQNREYIKPKCTNITVSQEGEDSEYIPVEEFIISMIYSISKPFEANYDYYNALAITIRSNIQSGTLASCEYKITNEEDQLFDFERLKSDNEKYIEIQDLIEDTNNLVITKPNEIGISDYFDVEYDAFCFDNIDKEGNYVLSQRALKMPKEWVETYVTDWYLLNCPCNQSGDEDQCTISTGHGKGLSTYGAYYLATEEEIEGESNRYSSYELILQFFFGDDIEIKTNDKEAEDEGRSLCVQDDMDILQTPLTRTEFVDLIEEFFKIRASSSKIRLFRDNAGAIYDMGKKIGANPEMVFIIAQKEQAWTSSFEGGSGCNNYWGYGITNGNKTGACFSSFEDGYTTILAYVKNKGTLEAFTKKYSYLGTYLANPGSSGDGGCYYLKLSDIYGENYSRCNSSYSCASSKGGTGCILTTDEEKAAYIGWQKQKIIKYRETIFKISRESCHNSNGDYDGSSDGHTILNESIAGFLNKNSSSLEEFNNIIFKEACKNKKTGAAVAAAASTAVKELGNYGKKFPYLWGGLHVKPSYYGVGADWGQGEDAGHVGPDCSGFVSWALYNAGFDYYSKTSWQWILSGKVVDLGDERAQIGDLIGIKANENPYDHVEIIVGIDYAKKIYYVAHASGQNAGVLFGKVSFSEGNKKLSLMSDYYDSLPENREFTETYCGG